MFEYFYNEILRRTIIGFGTLFNSISIKQDGSPLRVVSEDPPEDGFADNVNIESAADDILDFSEQTPFGIP